MKKEEQPGNNPKENTSGKNENQNAAPGKTSVPGHEPGKNPDPTTPERKHNPDPTKPEKEAGPYSDDSKQKEAGQGVKPKNPAKVESKNDEDIGSLEEQDIDDQGITGSEGEEDLSDNENDGDIAPRKSA